jgi:uncharacterized cupin superfamily protein
MREKMSALTGLLPQDRQMRGPAPLPEHGLQYGEWDYRMPMKSAALSGGERLAVAVSRAMHFDSEPLGAGGRYANNHTGNICFGKRKHSGSAILSKCAVLTAAIIAIVGPSPGAIAQALSPAPLYEGNTTIPTKNGATQAVHVSVQSWGIAGTEHEIPLQGFYVAHLLSGQISATIDGQTTQHLPGDYWTVKAGAAMRVKAGGEVAVSETTVVSKQ